MEQKVNKTIDYVYHVSDYGAWRKEPDADEFEQHTWTMYWLGTRHTELANDLRGIRVELERRKREATENGKTDFDKNILVYRQPYNKTEGKLFRVDLEKIAKLKQAQVINTTKEKLLTIKQARENGDLVNGIAPYGGIKDTPVHTRERVSPFQKFVVEIENELHGHAIEVCE